MNRLGVKGRKLSKKALRQGERLNRRCPHCGGRNTIKKGASRRGVRKFSCHDCRSYFQKTYTRRAFKVDQGKVVLALDAGESATVISRRFGISRGTVYSIRKRLEAPFQHPLVSFCLYQDGRWEENPESPRITVLNFSAGSQSTALLWMVVRGEIERPGNLVVLHADPGMENRETYAWVSKMRKVCEGVGIPFHEAKGPNLYEDLVGLRSSGRTRLDLPPYWLDRGKGKVGQLMQKCTRFYKIEPMDRKIREILAADFGISEKTGKIPWGCVEKWIGFTFDEFCRVKPPQQGYVRFRYPLVDLKLTKKRILDYYRERGHEVPPRSACNACFSNGIDRYREMALERPEDFRQAVQVDLAIRDLRQIGVVHPCFVSRTCRPVEELLGSDSEENLEGYGCDSGYCFV